MPPSPTGDDFALAFRAVLRVLGGVLLLVAVVAALSFFFRAELERYGAWFVARFGALGMATGAFLADGCHFPLPPQFFLFTGIAGGYSALAALASVLAGSVLGGLLAFAIGRGVVRARFVERQVAPARRLVEHLLFRHGYWGLVAAALLPISYWVLCTVGGAMRLPYRAYGVLALMRAPRLLLSFAIIREVWS